MPSSTIQFVFEPGISLADAEMSLHLAMFAVEGLIGRVRVRLEAKYHLDEPNRTIVVAGGSVGRMIARVFTGLLLREFGEGAFQVDRAHETYQPQLQELNT